jgi:hypothetical protein
VPLRRIEGISLKDAMRIIFDNQRFIDPTREYYNEIATQDFDSFSSFNEKIKLYMQKPC